MSSGLSSCGSTNIAEPLSSGSTVNVNSPRLAKLSAANKTKAKPIRASVPKRFVFNTNGIAHKARADA